MTKALPESLLGALRPVTVIVGHYGAGKTNFTVNLAVDLSACGRAVTVVDLDVVNPYFRASEQRALLEASGVRLVAPVFSEAATSLDVPSLTGRIDSAFADAGDDGIVLVDAGGDDVGATALGRYARLIGQREHAMLYVANRFRNLISNLRDAMENLREIEVASHLAVTGVVNNSHLKADTTEETVSLGQAYAAEFAEAVQLPLVCNTVPPALPLHIVENAYAVQPLVKNPWE